ncbi:MAG: hypothetical protein Q9220_003301 [cf. Caloplaca sp. 1 TL-2023]
MASDSPPPRRPLPQPVETSKRAQRRFAPDPIETTARSNHPPQDGAAANARRRVLPQPVDSTARSNRAHDTHNDTPSPPASDASPQQPARKNLPQPIQSSTSSSKTRKFAPQLVETTSRQRKRGDTLPAVLETDKTEHTPGDVIPLPRHLQTSRPGVLPVPPVNSPIVSTDQVPQLQESKFSFASLSKRVGLDKPDRRHSFRVPELPSIPSQVEESEESDASTCPSLSTSPSAESDEAELRKNASKAPVRKSSGYLLSLAARAAEKQLRDQAMAAYPNEHFHEPFDHFAVDREAEEAEEGAGLRSRSATYPTPGGSDSSTPRSRRESHAGWDVAEMRKHKEDLERRRRECKDRDQSMTLDRKHSVKDAGKAHHRGHHYDHQHHKRPSSRNKNPAAPAGPVGGQQHDDQMKPMHKAASPPMAGQDLRFPKCQTPRQTRLDVHQYPGAPLHLGSPPSRNHSGLWTPHGGASRQNSKSGLWMGVCATSAQKPAAPAIVQTGLLTPQVEKDDPFAPTNQTSAMQQLPPSPPTSVGSSKSSCLNEVLSREKSIEDEFHDGFVTQVYNYLSLGYPALARKYDHELSKITRIPVESLRQDDAHTNVKGYVGAPEGTGCDMRGVQEGQCERWTALRLYITEWARQQPRMGVRDGAANEDWGARARKGSWAL